MLATKLRALRQRNKGRDLFDLMHSPCSTGTMTTAGRSNVSCCTLTWAELAVSRAEAQQSKFQKLVNPTFFIDMRPLLSTDRARALTDETFKATFARVMKELIDRIPGNDLAKAGEMRERFGI
jgi:predicted nucleotidyltransferase component of viral defense system